MATETEIKLVVPEPPDLVLLHDQLDKHGEWHMVTHPKELEYNAIYDMPSKALQEAKKTLRLRTVYVIPFGKGNVPWYDYALLTYKGPSTLVNGVKSRTEIETQVQDPEDMHTILMSLGYELLAERSYQKYRHMVIMTPRQKDLLGRGSVFMCIDELPFGHYVELEGQDVEVIQRARQDLGLGEAQVETRSYQTLAKESGLHTFPGVTLRGIGTEYTP